MAEKEKIIKACKKGKRGAFTKLYNMYANKMLGVCMRYAKSLEEAEDILQEGFIKVFQKIDTYAFQGSFDGWIRRVMVNTAINHYNANKKYYENELYASDSNEEGDRTEFQEDDKNEIQIPPQVLMSMIQQLPEGYKMVFNLYVFEGMTHMEIASFLGISESTSKTQLLKARKKLKKTIEEKYGINTKA
jgi:RNA polymerase sigma-70 factor (ECF subfamily)